MVRCRQRRPPPSSSLHPLSIHALISTHPPTHSTHPPPRPAPWPHSETQCASSTASEASLPAACASLSSSLQRRGAQPTPSVVGTSAVRPPLAHALPPELPPTTRFTHTAQHTHTAHALTAAAPSAGSRAWCRAGAAWCLRGPSPPPAPAPGGPWRVRASRCSSWRPRCRAPGSQTPEGWRVEAQRRSDVTVGRQG